MLGKEITTRVQSHYRDSQEPLLLSRFGKTLRVEGLWPVEDEERSLREVIESLRPDVDVIRDPKALAFAVVVAKGKEEIAHKAIKNRHESRFLENLPRSVVLAFVVKKTEGSNVYLRTKYPFRYSISTVQEDEDFVPVEDEYRSDGAYIENVRELESGTKVELASKIRNWAKKHDISLDIFYDRDPQPHSKREGYASLLTHDAGAIAAPRRNALERLRAAQPPGVAERMVVPLDIALALSRLV